LVSGDLITYLCDDDIFYAHAFATFVSYYRRNPRAQAIYASQDIAAVYPNGWRALIGERRASGPGGQHCQGRPMDCHVDYLQFCHKAEVLRLLGTTAYWPEGKDTESHADGIFMERVGEHVMIYPLDVKVAQNRRTSQSTYVPLSSFTVVECMANGAPFLPSRTGEIAKVCAVPDMRESTRNASPDQRNPCPATDLEDVPLVTVSIVCRNQDTFLSDKLASVAAQTYPRLEVLVLSDDSTDDESLTILEMMRSRHSGFRFLDQGCLGSRVTRDSGLWEAHGDYFIPLAADTLACPNMVERFVTALRRNPDLSAITCYVLALREARPPFPGTPPIVPASNLLASTKNLYTSGIFRTAHLRDIGGYGTDSETPGQDWIGFLGLVNAGCQVDILPEHLFFYPPVPHGARDDSPPCERVLRPFFQADQLLAAERVALWTAFHAMQRHLERLTGQNRALREQNEALQNRLGSWRYRVADRLTLLCDRLPFAKRVIHWLFREPDAPARVLASASGLCKRNRARSLAQPAGLEK
jgi:hypothetical protein